VGRGRRRRRQRRSCEGPGGLTAWDGGRTASLCSVENTSGGLRSQFVSGFGGGIRIASATEHSQVLIGGGDSIEGEVWTGRANRLGGEAIQQI
jgi:hypothetical protein